MPILADDPLTRREFEKEILPKLKGWMDGLEAMVGAVQQEQKEQGRILRQLADERSGLWWWAFSARSNDSVILARLAHMC